MKKLLSLALAAAVYATFLPAANAQTIVWGSSTQMVGDNDVLSTGGYIDAATFFSSAVTVNTVTFNPLTLSSGAYTDASGDISITTPNGGAGAYTAPFSATSPSSTNYSNLTSVLGFTVGVSGTVTLSDLTGGDTYRVQAWSYYTGTTTGGSTTLTGTTPVNLLSTTGAYALGTFTAPGAVGSTGNTETFGYAVNAADNHAIINAVSVYDTTAAVPEPSTYLLMGLGILGLVLVRQRKLLS